MRPCIFLALLFFVVGCTTDRESAEDEIRDLLPAAASMSLDAMNQLASSPASPTLDSVKSQSLTAIFLFLQPSHVDVSEENFQRHVAWLTPTYPHPADFIKPMMASEGDGYASVIQPGSVSDLSCTLEEGRATGSATFTLAGILEGTIDYSARRENDSWLITSFEIPHLQAKTVLQEDGTWKAHGQGVAPVISVRLPSLDQVGPRVESAGRLVISARRSLEDTLEIAIGDEKTSLENFSTLLLSALAANDNRGIAVAETTAVIRADRQLDSGSLHAIVSECSGAGIRLFRLPLDRRQAEPAIFTEPGEIAFRLPAGDAAADTPPLQITLSADNDGYLSGIQLHDKQFGSIEDLHRSLREILGNQHGQFSLVTNAALKYDLLAEVLGACITNETSAPLTVDLSLAAETPAP